MKKRLFCLLLCLLMVLPMALMAGCSSEAETDEEAASTTNASGIKAMTLTLYAITEEGTTEEAIELAQAAINEITEAKFNTHIVLRLYEEDEYYDVIEEKIQAIEDQAAFEEQAAAALKVANKAAKAAGVTTAPETTDENTTVETDETMLNEYGLQKTVYPEVDDNQLDIFLLTNLEKYKEYYTRECLLALDEELSVNCKILNDYIYPTFMSAMKLEGKTYAVPNNHMVGEFQYMLVNKELFDKYYFDPSKLTVVNDLEEYVATIAEKEAGVTPVIDNVGGIESYMYYPTGEESVVAGYSAGKLAVGTKSALKNIFGIRQYKTAEALVYDWDQAGYIKADASIDEGNFGVAFVKGDYSLAEKYKENYYVTTYKNPTFTNEEAYGSMYAVGAYTKSVSRCMEIIKYLTINEELRNAFQYGALNVNYEIDEYTGIVNILNHDYDMNPLYTGNMFKLWQNNEMDEQTLAYSANAWELAKLQNFNSSVSPYLGFEFNEEDAVEEDGEEEAPAATEEVAEGEEAPVVYKKTSEIFAGLREVSEEYLAKLDNFAPFTYNEETIESVTDPVTGEVTEQTVVTPVEILTLADYIDYLAAELDENEFVMAALDAENENSLAGQYEAWYTANYGAAE